MSMSGRHLHRLVAVLFGALALTAGSAHAASYVHAGTASGNVLAAGTTVAPGASGSMTFAMSGWGSVSCAASGDLTVGASGGATVAATVDALDWTGCTDTIPSITYTSCAVASPLPTASLLAAGSAGGTLSLSGWYMRCGISGTTRGCYYYAALANGTYTNATAAAVWTGVSLLHTVPSGSTDDLGALCGPGSGSLSQTWNDVSASGATLVLNGTP
jgi:hypothetical protein